MTDTFITRIEINKVRHLLNLTIPLSETGRQHLIITGKNGSGKTSVLEAMYNCFSISNRKENDENLPFLPSTHDGLSNICVYFNHDHLERKYIEQLPVIYIPAHRKLEIKPVNAIEKIIPHQSEQFFQYFVWLDYLQMNAERKGDMQEVLRIKKWFDTFLQILRDIYNSPELRLNYKAEELTCTIEIPDHEPFRFNEMADGYSAFFKIVMELMMRMESQASGSYDMPGIALIDEIETHLHVEMQKKVLPFLTKMFPNIQFIVTTHSPFVISSLENAVICDLEYRTVLTDLSAYSYDGIVEYYYNSDKYSEKIKSDFENYKSLINKRGRSDEENAHLVELITYLKNIPAAAAPELIRSFRQLELQRRSGNGQN